MKNRIVFDEKRQLLLLFAVWLCVQAALLYKYGIITTNEAVKYYREAINFLSIQKFSEQKYIFYSAYIFIRVFFINLHAETVGVYIFQLLINLTATYLFYKTGQKIYKRTSIAFFATLLLVVCFPWQYWTVCLYTESFFCSLIIILMYCLFGTNSSYRLKYTYAFLIIMLLIFARPTGLLFLLVLLCLLLFRLIAVKKYLTAILSALAFIVAFVFLLHFEMNSAASYNFIKPFIESNIICDVPSSSQNVPASIHGSGINAVMQYLRNNPAGFLYLCFKRFISFWGLTRSFYSPLHNWILRLAFYPIYLFALAGIKKQWKLNKELFLFSVSSLAVFTISVMLTCDEWSNRFIMPVIPLVIFSASYGLFTIFEKQNE